MKIGPPQFSQLNNGGVLSGFPIPIPPLPVQVKKIHGKHVLYDGYHRVLALKKAGYEFVPCIVTEAISVHQIITNIKESFQVNFLLMNEKPPTIGHFFSGVTEKVKLLPFAKTFHIQIEEDYIILPK